MIELLPEWNGEVVKVMCRMYMTKQALAKEMGMSRPYVSKLINSEHVTDESKKKVEDALESFARSRGLVLKNMKFEEE